MSNFIHTKNQTPVNLDLLVDIRIDKYRPEIIIFQSGNFVTSWTFEDQEESTRVYNEIIKLHSQEI